MDTKTKCSKCDNDAVYTQPDAKTGNIIDVCKKHFTLMHIG